MDHNGEQLYSHATTSRKSDYPLVTLPRDSVDPRFSQMMNQRQSNLNPGPFYQQNSELNVSRIEPHQFETSSSTAQMVRSNAWGAATAPKNNGMNQMTNASSQFNCSKLCAKITSTKILFFMIGFILCAIPLAVMTTLWINESSTSTDQSSTIASITTSSVTSIVSLPIQCYAYGNLNDAYRNIQNSYPCCYSPYDYSSTLTVGWYRVSGSAGTRLLTTPVSTTGTCGETFPGYFNGTLPSTPGAVTTGNVCFYTGSTCGYSLSPISVLNCNGYYIFYLIPTGSSSYKYCTTN